MINLYTEILKVILLLHVLVSFPRLLQAEQLVNDWFEYYFSQSYVSCPLTETRTSLTVRIFVKQSWKVGWSFDKPPRNPTML